MFFKKEIIESVISMFFDGRSLGCIAACLDISIHGVEEILDEILI